MITFIFASTAQQINIASHNLHGFKKSSAFHKQCIQNYEGIWLAQELWLPENRLSDLSALGVNYVARSGMEDSFSSGIYNGRPHGGVSIAWSSNLDHVIKPLANYRHKRIACVEVSAQPDPLLIASIYMPFYDTSNKHECIAESQETIAMLEEILADHPCHKIVLAGDFNTEFQNTSVFDRLWNEFTKKYNLTFNLDKCIYSCTRLALMGYIVEHNSVKPDPERLKPLMELPSPQDLPSQRRIVKQVG